MTAVEPATVAIILEHLRHQGFHIRPHAGAPPGTYIAARTNPGQHSEKRITIGPSSGRRSLEKMLAELRRAGVNGTADWELPGRSSRTPRTPPVRARDDYATLPPGLAGRTEAAALPADIQATAARHRFDFSGHAIDECARQGIGVYEAIAAVTSDGLVINVPGGHPARYVRGDVCVVFEPRSSGVGGTVHNVIDLGRERRTSPRVARHPAAATLPKESPMARYPNSQALTALEAVTKLVRETPAGALLTFEDVSSRYPQFTSPPLYKALGLLSSGGMLRRAQERPALWEVAGEPAAAPAVADPFTVARHAEPAPEPEPEPQPAPEPAPDAPPAEVVPDVPPAGGVPQVPDEPDSALSERLGPLATVPALWARSAGGLEHRYELDAPPPEEPDDAAMAIGQFLADADKLRQQEQPGTWARLMRLRAADLPPELVGQRMRLTVQLVPGAERGGPDFLDVYARWTRA